MAMPMLMMERIRLGWRMLFSIGSTCGEEGGRLRWETLMPTSSDALIFMRMYTAESSRPPTCAEGEARADVMQAASVGVGEERREREGRWGKKATERLE